MFSCCYLEINLTYYVTVGFGYDYFEIFDKSDITNCNPASKPIVAASAVTFEDVRLIDNIIVDF